MVFALRVGNASELSLQERIDSAQPGDTIRVLSGEYAGGIIVSKSLQLIGEAGAEIRGKGRGCVVTVNAPDVTLSGFLITGSGRDLSADDAAVFVTADRVVISNNRIQNALHGIYLKKVNDCIISKNWILGTALDPAKATLETGLGAASENCDASAPKSGTPGNGIHQWNCERNQITDNRIEHVRDGMYFSFTNHCSVSGNTVRNVRYGLHYMYSDDNVFVGNHFSENAAGAAIMFSERLQVRDNEFAGNRGNRACGLLLQSVDDSTIESNRIEQNAMGLSLNQCNRNRITGNWVGRNYIGLRFGGNSDENLFSANTFTRNLHPAEISGEMGSNRFEIAGVGNRWDHTVQLDLNGDGIGDFPHREVDFFGVLRRDFPQVSLLTGSPALRLLRFAHQRVALPGVDSIQDNAPLMPGFLPPIQIHD